MTASLRQAAQMALLALDNLPLVQPTWHISKIEMREEAINTLRAALAVPDEPVAWKWELLPDSPINKNKGAKSGVYLEDPASLGMDIASESQRKHYRWTPLYDAAPVPVEREPLTDEQLDCLCEAQLLSGRSLQDFARVIEHAHSIKGAA